MRELKKPTDRLRRAKLASNRDNIPVKREEARARLRVWDEERVSNVREGELLREGSAFIARRRGGVLRFPPPDLKCRDAGVARVHGGSVGPVMGTRGWCRASLLWSVPTPFTCFTVRDPT